tara:strand:+ start:592 stop:897 length:306 start_codon:yes stop_codon:yes gene_type:complete
MRLIIDLDGTICTEEKTFSRTLAKPIRGAKEALCKLRDAEHTIIIYSARSWNEYEMTEDWLRRHKIPFDQLVMGKPVGDYWIDDRAIKFERWENVLSTLNL